MKTGRLLDVLSGHEGPVHGLVFSPTNVSHIFHLFTIWWCPTYLVENSKYVFMKFLPHVTQ